MKKILINANIYTACETHPRANAMAFEGEQITFVGDLADPCKIDPSDAEVIDLKGRMVLPGFIDSHIHPGMVSQSMWHIRLPWTEDPEELLAFVKDYAEKHPEIPFLYFEYYPTSMFGEKGPCKEMLDEAVPDRPCLCQDFGEHLHWVNSKMLEAMEITKDTPDPVPGLEMFVRDENGEPTGWLKELVHMRFMDKLSRNIGWKPPLVMTPERMEGFFGFLTEHGITAIADGILEGEEQLISMRVLEEKGELNVYYDGIVRFWSLADLPEKISELRRYQRKYASKHIKLNTMKLFLDGTNESGNSALLSPHLCDPEGKNCGEIKMETDELTQCFLLCNREGVDVHIHMVGDRAFRVACDAVEEAQQQARAAGVPWVSQLIFAHCELIDPSDMDRPAKLGITINWSPHWSGGYFGEEAIRYIGSEKWKRMYQFSPILQSGARVTFSSDVVTGYELHRADPFFGMQVGHTRVDPEFPLDPQKYHGSVRPLDSAKLSRETLLLGYTLRGAEQLRWEKQMGSLEVGKLANFCVISDDFFEVPEDQISDIRFEAVVFEGALVHGELCRVV